MTAFPRVLRMADSLTEKLTFEQALAELDRIVRDLEDGELGLESALDRYESGIALLKRCYAQLREAEQRIVQITGVDAEGKPVLQPFEHAATTDLAEGDGKPRRRKKEDDGALPLLDN
jgi:exodeoxyribonuclease VII small subunit